MIKADSGFSIGKLRNIGIENSRGKYIIFIDSDCITERNLLKGYMKYLKKYDVVFGRWLPSKYRNIFEKFKAIEFFTFNKKKGRQKRISSENFIPPASCNMGIRKNSYKKFLGFDEINYIFRPPAGEDVELAWRWLNSGARILFSPDLIVEHEHRFNFYTFFKKSLSYGRTSFVSRSLNMKKIQWAGEMPLPNVMDILLILSVMNLSLLIPWYLLKLLVLTKKYKKGITSIKCIKTTLLLPFIDTIYQWGKFLGFVHEFFRDKTKRPNLVRVVVMKGKDFLVLKRKSGIYQFITGKIEKNESTKAAAIRELYEETGIINQELRKIGKIMEFEIDDKKVKAITFLCETNNDKVKISDEHVLYKILSLGETLRTLTFADDRQIAIACYEIKENL